MVSIVPKLTKSPPRGVARNRHGICDFCETNLVLSSISVSIVAISSRPFGSSIWISLIFPAFLELPVSGGEFYLTSGSQTWDIPMVMGLFHGKIIELKKWEISQLAMVDDQKEKHVLVKKGSASTSRDDNSNSFLDHRPLEISVIP